jgi:hypothetical protein
MVRLQEAGASMKSRRGSEEWVVIGHTALRLDEIAAYELVGVQRNETLITRIYLRGNPASFEFLGDVAPIVRRALERQERDVGVEGRI